MPSKAKSKKIKQIADDDGDFQAAALDTKPSQSDIVALDDGDSDGDGDDSRAVNKAAATKKKVKENKKALSDEEDDAVAGIASPPPLETAVNLDEEWPEEDVKPKKGKKGRTAKKVVDDDEVMGSKQDETGVQALPAPTPENGMEEDEPVDAEAPKLLTKAQKERLKKEKEKAKKKASATSKKVAEAHPEPVPEASLSVAPEAEEDDDADEGGAGTDKKKKKKKKPAAPPPEVATGKGKKVPAHIAAMQAAVEEKKRIEEAARQAEAERLRLIEEEDERIAAEERRIEEQKAAKRAKERDKRAVAKAEGRLLTPAQKREKAAAEARKQAMLASGMKVAGLQADGGEKKKAGSTKRKPGKVVKNTAEVDDAADEMLESPATPSMPEVDAPIPSTNGEADWDKSDDEAAVEDIVAGVDDMKVDGDWDVSEDESISSAPAVVLTPPVETAAPVKPATNILPTAKTNGKPVPSKANGAVPKQAGPSIQDDSSSEDSSESDESSEDELEVRKRRATARINERQEAARAAKSKDDLRSPICCILGHVDTGKTKLLDKIRQTSVQEGEAGGITQQIGATFFPKTAIQEKTAVVNQTGAYEVQIPGLLIIDTPGHESFTNLRSRGSSLCNIAILVVDITHGLEPQTIESLNLLRNGKTPFIVALNKIDRMYGWKPTPNGGFRESFALQSRSVRSEFEDRVNRTKLAFAEQGLNAEVFDENTNLGRTISLVPTSAISGEGIPDMLMLLVKLTQERMNQSLMYISELECTILEVKIIEGLGTTIDVILSNGVMKEGDKIVLCGMDGPIITNVRALLTPQPLRELRVKSAYVHHKEVKAALGVKISAPGLEKAIAGARLYVAQDDDEVEAYKDLAMADVNDLQRFITKGPGVWVQASTLGSLEALLTFLKQMEIPVRNFAIGPVFRSHVIRAGRMLETAAEFALILAFDVPIDKEAKEYADKEGVKIFSAMIIYHLFDAFRTYMNEVKEAKRLAAMPHAVWPVRLSIIKAFAHRDPIVLGVDIVEGTLRTNTPVGVVKTDKETGKREIVTLGKITSIEINHKSFEIVKKSQIGAGAAVRIERASHQTAKSYGRHFDDKDEVVSLITRQSIDTLKTSFRDKVDLTEWAMIKKMKVEQGVS